VQGVTCIGCAGEPVTLELPYRLKHLTTNEYLYMAADGQLSATDRYLEPVGHLGGMNRCQWSMDTAVGVSLSSHDMRVQFGRQAILQSSYKDVYIGVKDVEIEGQHGRRVGIASQKRVEKDALEFGTVDASVSSTLLSLPMSHSVLLSSPCRQ